MRLPRHVLSGCFVLTQSCTSVLPRIRFIFKLYATFSGILALFGLASLLRDIVFSPAMVK